MATTTQVIVRTQTNPFGVPIVVENVELDEEEFPGRPPVIVPPFSSPEMEALHKSACLMCADEDQPIVSADEVVENIIKRVAPEYAKDVRPTPKQLLSGTGALRSHALRCDMARQTEYKETDPTE